MIALADTLAPEQIALSLKSTDRKAAIREAASLLQNAHDVLDWETLLAGLEKSAPCLDHGEGDFAICLPHVRTDAVRAMVMSVARYLEGLSFPDSTKPVRYIFCIGVPKAMDKDYLRIVGLLTRILREPEYESELRAAKTANDFIEVLTRLEAKL